MSTRGKVRINTRHDWRRAGGRTVVVLPSLLGACDPMVHDVVTRRAAVGADCPDATRDFVITRKRSCCPDREPQVARGRITFGADEDRREMFGASDIRLKHSELLDLFGAALGSPEVWTRLRVTYPSTGAAVFDSGEVRREDGFCAQKPYSFRFDSKCPP